MAAFTFFPDLRASPQRWSTVARVSPRLSATTAIDLASGGVGRPVEEDDRESPASFAALIIGTMLLASRGTTTIPSTRRVMKAADLLELPVGVAVGDRLGHRVVPLVEVLPDRVDGGHPELGLERLEGDADRGPGRLRLAGREGETHERQEGRRGRDSDGGGEVPIQTLRGGVVVVQHLDPRVPYAVGGFRMDSSCALTASGSNTLFQSGLNSTAWASASIFRAPSE